MSTELPEPSIGYLTKGLQQLLRAEITTAAHDVGVSLLEFTALSTVADHSGISNAELARRCFVTPQTVHRAVMALEERGLLARSPASTGRQMPMLVTPSGRKVLHDCDRVSAEIHGRMLRDFSRTDVVRFRQYLSHAARNLSADRVSGSQEELPVS